MDFVPLFAADDLALNYAVTHVFFPVEIPPKSNYTARNDLSLLRAVRTAARAYIPYIDDTLKPRWNSIVKMLDNLKASVRHKHPKKGDITSLLSTMQSGDVLAFHIRAQRSAVIFRKRENGTLYESFETSLRREAVERARGSPVYSFAGLAVEIPNQVFEDVHFQVELANFLSLPSKVDSDPPNVPADHPEYITALLTGILRSVGRIVAGSRVLKRVRDDIVSMNRPVGEAWRRSSLWLLIRVSIQTSLDRSSSGWPASYKAFMLFFICNLAMDAHTANVSNDLLFLMLAKILRRLSKLGSSTPSWLSDMALDACRRLQDTLDARAMELQASKLPLPHWNPSELDLIGDTQFLLPNIDECVHGTLANPGDASLVTLSQPKEYLRISLQDFFSSAVVDGDSLDPYVVLYDIERSVERDIDQWVTHVTNMEEACIQLGTLMDTYLSIATELSSYDPESCSIMVLTWMEMWVALDKLAVAEIPMLAEYSPEIPTQFLESLLLRDTTNLHRLSRVYHYLHTRRSMSREGSSVLSNEFTKDSFPVRYYDSSPDMQQLWNRIEMDVSWRLTLPVHGSSSRQEDQHNRHRNLDEDERIKSTTHVPLLQSKVITFELQCPAPIRIWRSVVAHLLCQFDFKRAESRSSSSREDSVSFPDSGKESTSFPELQPYSTEISFDARTPFLLGYSRLEGSESRDSLRLCYTFKQLPDDICEPLEDGPSGLISQLTEYDLFCKGEREYIQRVTSTTNGVLSEQSRCPPDLPLDEYIAFGHLRSGGSLQWTNILRDLRGRALNFRSYNVYLLLAQATSQVGPLDMVTGEWTWHQELQNQSFCSTLLDELESLFLDVSAGSLDEVAMRTISLLLTRVLASSPCESISERILQILRDVRRKTLEWVQELAYDLAQAPTNEKRYQRLHCMAATCRSTFDTRAGSLHRVFRSAADVHALLSCSFFLQATQLPSCPYSHWGDRRGYSDDTLDYSGLLYQHNHRLSVALERVLKDVVLADVMDYGIDLALRDIWPGYRPGPRRWAPKEHPNSHWLVSTTAVIALNERSQVVHVNLLNGSILVDGRPLGGLPEVIRDHPSYKKLFHKEALLSIPSDLPGMEFATLSTISSHRVHFALRGDHLVIQAQHKDINDVLELVLPEKLKGCIPTSLLEGHVHWLNLSTSVIEIRPLENVWEESYGNWRIRGAHGKYRIYRGCESLVGMQSQTWTMVSRLLACMDLPENLMVTTSTIDSLQMLSVALPRHGLSFFVNSDGDLESDDFGGMIYDRSQEIGTLFGLEERLVLRSKLEILEEAFPSRYVLVPLIPLKDLQWETSLLPVTYYGYKLDYELGCLMGDSSLESKHFLAYLHAKTSIDWRPDPFTGRTGVQEALSILQSSGYQSLAAARAAISSKYSGLRAVDVAHALHYSLGHQFRGSFKSASEERAGYLFLLDVAVSPLPGLLDQTRLSEAHASDLQDIQLEDTVYNAASLVDHCWQTNHASTITSISDWAGVWDGIISRNTDEESLYDIHKWDPALPQALLTQIGCILQEHSTTWQRYQLLFRLLPLAYCSSHPQTAFLSLFLAFTKKQEIPHADYNLLDGYCPTIRVIQHYPRYCEDPAEITYLLSSWPFDGIPSNTDARGVPNLTPALQAFFSSCYRNRRLKEDLVRIVMPDFQPTSKFLASLPFLQYTLGQSSDVHLHMSQAVQIHHSELSPTPAHWPKSSWRVTLDLLLSTRAPPTPPYLTKFSPHRSDKNEHLYHHLPAFDRLFPSTRLNDGHHPFQEQYITDLHSSARYVREECETVHRTLKAYPINELKDHLVRCLSGAKNTLHALRQSLDPGPNNPLEQALARGGQWPQVTARSLLRRLGSTSSIKLSESWKICLTRFALLLLECQRTRRLLRFALEGREEEYLKELENEGCNGWKAEEYPDWLLIQLQGGFLIRRVQADIAMEMISPQSGKNTVMQVNMGEGKSSVIIPIVAAFLADGSQLVRVVVPKPLMAQMLYHLADCLGGLADRRIHQFPISRSRFSEEREIKTMRANFSRWMEDRCVLLVQPEHISSLKLMSVEAQLQKRKLAAQPSSQLQKLIHRCHDVLAFKSVEFLKDSSYTSHVLRSLSWPWTTGDIAGFIRPNKGSELLEHQKWLHPHARDILDESDDILHARHQLIYTVGHEQHIEGYPDRWMIIQQVLKLVQRHAHSLSKNLPDSVEYSSRQPGSFPRFRISRTSSDAGRLLISLLVGDVMAGHLPMFDFRPTSQAQRNAIRTFISSENLQFDKAKEVEEYAKQSWQSNLWSGLLLLRGLFACNILLYALAERRWRVDYGLHPKPKEPNSSKHTNLAVPYLAKDIPVPNTQFGQPDIVIILTCLSYYYTGLTEEQLKIAFQILLDRDDPDVEYALWVKGVDSTTLLPDSLRKIAEFNLESSEQWDNYLFPVFSCNKAAIDFYLSHIVFPREAKEYPWKLAASSWDLAEERVRPVTGFSGTNDSQYLLPMSIKQHRLEHQEGASAMILSYLLQPENNAYMLIPRENDEPAKTIDLLKMVTAQQPQIHVLLDVGAQILDVRNHDLAEQWLSLTSSAGAVYFDEDDNLMVLMRNGRSQPLMSSSFAQRLDRCVIYLDDAHTRGTDLKFPKGFRAAVTLGPKVTKDRLVQGCMRMRKLGRGHSVMFFAPLEVDQSIRSIVRKEDRNIQINTADILKWAIHETWSDIQRWAPHWAQQGMDHTARYDAWSRFCGNEIAQEQLSDAWLQPEAKSLTDLYAPHHEPRSTSGSTSLKLQKDIERHCEYLGVPMSSLRKAQLDEQVEREVNREIEKEREVELPPRAMRAIHSLHPDVVTFVQTGALRASDAFRPVFTSLENSSAASVGAHTWSPFILATADFCKTIEQTSTRGRVDQYLRPVQWVLSGKKNENRVLVVLSPFEVDRLLPDIRISEHVHLHVYAPRTSARMKPTDDLRFYSIPPLPGDWMPPWDLIDQLNIFAGQVYLRDWDAYLRLTRFLDVQKKAREDTMGKPLLYNLFNLESWKDLTNERPDSLLPSVMMLLAIRRRGLSFAETHMGKILQGRLLSEKDFEGPAPSNSTHEPTRCDGQVQTKMGSSGILLASSSQTGWGGEDGAVSSSLGQGSKHESEADVDSETNTVRLPKPRSFFDFDSYIWTSSPVSSIVIWIVFGLNAGDM